MLTARTTRLLSPVSGLVTVVAGGSDGVAAATCTGGSRVGGLSSTLSWAKVLAMTSLLVRVGAALAATGSGAATGGLGVPVAGRTATVWLDLAPSHAPPTQHRT